MGLADDIADYLATGGLSSVSLYRGEMPARPLSCGVVVPTSGMGTARFKTFGGRLAEHCRVQLRFRATDFQTVDRVAVQAYTLMDNMPARSLNGRAYHFCQPVSTPYYLGLDDQDLPVMTTNFDIWRGVTS